MPDEERRQRTIEEILVLIGKLEKSSEYIHDSIDALRDRVEVQNGRVNKVEDVIAEHRGAIRFVKWFIVANIPVIIFVATQFTGHFK